MAKAAGRTAEEVDGMKSDVGNSGYSAGCVSVLEKDVMFKLQVGREFNRPVPSPVSLVMVVCTNQKKYYFYVRISNIRISRGGGGGYVR